MKTHAELVYHHAYMLPHRNKLTSADLRSLRSARHYIDIALGNKPDRGDFDNAADAEAIKHEAKELKPYDG